MRTRPTIGPFLRQGLAWSALCLMTLIGRWLQGGDRPIAPGLRLLYAAFIIAAVAYVAHGLVVGFPTVYAKLSRIAGRARRQPAPAILLLVIGGGSLALITLLLGDLPRNIEVLVDGGDLGIVGFTGDNSDRVRTLLITCLLLCDAACLFACGIVGRWRRERRRLGEIRHRAGARRP